MKLFDSHRYHGISTLSMDILVINTNVLAIRINVMSILVFVLFKQLLMWISRVRKITPKVLEPVDINVKPHYYAYTGRWKLLNSATASIEGHASGKTKLAKEFFKIPRRIFSSSIDWYTWRYNQVNTSFRIALHAIK